MEVEYIDPNEMLRDLRKWAKSNSCSTPGCPKHKGAQIFENLDIWMTNGNTPHKYIRTDE